MFLLCRTLGHAWLPIPAEKASSYGDAMWLRCERCDAERHDGVDGSGGIITRRYVYDPNYRHAFDSGFDHAAPSRAEFRRMLLMSDIDKLRRARQRHTH